MEIIQEEYKKFFSWGLIALVTILSLYFGIKFLSEARSFGAAGVSTNTITLSGYGEVSAVPDIASVYFTIEKEAKTAADAQTAVATVEKKALEYLRTAGIEDKDIRTDNVSVYPKYDYQYSEVSLMPCTEYGCPPRPGKNVIVGYTASESITVKVGKIDDAGKIMQGLGGVGVSNLNGPNFEIDNEDALKADARREAIEDARNKARVLARDLGVRLGRIVTFSESDYGFPMYARMEALDAGMGGTTSVKAPSAELPKGENIISANVSITFEIR